MCVARASSSARAADLCARPKLRRLRTSASEAANSLNSSHSSTSSTSSTSSNCSKVSRPKVKQCPMGKECWARASLPSGVCLFNSIVALLSGRTGRMEAQRLLASQSPPPEAQTHAPNKKNNTQKYQPALTRRQALAARNICCTKSGPFGALARVSQSSVHARKLCPVSSVRTLHTVCSTKHSLRQSTQKAPHTVCRMHTAHCTLQQPAQLSSAQLSANSNSNRQQTRAIHNFYYHYLPIYYCATSISPLRPNTERALLGHSLPQPKPSL